MTPSLPSGGQAATGARGSISMQFQWSVLRSKNLGFCYILRWWRKHVLFMAEFVAEAITIKCRSVLQQTELC